MQGKYLGFLKQIYQRIKQQEKQIFQFNGPIIIEINFFLLVAFDNSYLTCCK